MTPSEVEGNSSLEPEQQARAGTYALLAALLRNVPDSVLLARLQTIDNDSAVDDDLARAWHQLREAAISANPATIDDEFHSLFIGVGRGELVPYGSWYTTGFLMEKPLGLLRRDLATLGLERQEQVHEPEDHVAALCEVMTLLISDPDYDFPVQQRIFEAHLNTWIETFFKDLENAKAAHFYRAVGTLGRAFVQLEKRFFAMPV